MPFSSNQQSQYMRSLIEASLDPLVAISPEGKITDVNEANVNITGLPRNQLIGTFFHEHFTEPEAAREVYREVFAKGFIADSPLTFLRVGGKLTDVLINGSVYKDDQGKVLGVVAVARDVTAQKLLSKYSLSLIEASLDPLVTISSEGKITDMNEATVNIIGASRQKLIGTDFFDYFTAPEKAREGYQQVFAKGFVSNYPLTIRHTNGKLTDVLFNGSVYKDDRGNVLGVVVVARDITEQKRIETELVEAKVFAELARHIAEEAVKAKQQFLSNMSHEIRTPMNAIIGFTKVVLKTELTAKQKEYLSAIQLSGDALIVLINDILDLAKVDAGKMTFEETPFKLSASVSAMLHLFEPKMQEKNLVLVKEYDHNIPEVVVGDPVRLHQIILNLVSNAVKFTAEGTITARVRMLTESDDNVVVQFSIGDTGIGIAESKIDNIFENFQQATSGTSRIFGGTGLGLAIAKQLVEAQGGTLTADSKLGVGSTFSFDLTFKKTTAKAETEIEEELPYADENHKIKVLVVEDIALNQLLMKTLLDDFGFTHDIAGNGKIAIQNMRKNHYDLVLMDLQMPEMNGFEATDYIRNTLKLQIPIIALTADVTTVDIEKCKSVGMNDYIAKPVDERLLYNKITKLLKKPQPIPESSLTSEALPGQPAQRCTSLDYLIRQTKSNPALIREMIRLYLDQTPVLIATMKTSLRTLDWRSLHSAVHKMIPSFAIMGISQEYELMAKKMQEYAINHEHVEDVNTIFLKLESICNQACNELEEDYAAIEERLGGTL